jgi:hypothetical protein
VLNWYHWEQDVRKGEETRPEIIRKAAPIFNQKDMTALRFLISCEPG